MDNPYSDKPFVAAQMLTSPGMMTVECYSAETARFVVEHIADGDNVELVCPTNPEHRLWYPIGLLDVEPAPWCLCVPVDISVPLSVRDNHMKPRNRTSAQGEER